ncbi:MAG: peptide chain release factor N(5)-glutamine methyltransferase [Clostridia bacterium]|nr:peptide chain release factor N(5)-glutamine methyltransferase [Clostridia bacterium]
MTGRELYLKTKKIFSDNDGERFFSFSLLWAAICEKRSLGTSLALSEDPFPDHKTVLEDARKLCGGEPIQYYLGHWEFCGHDFLCRENVLIPRDDTEVLVGLCVRELPENGLLADLCCGSGCVGISVLLSRPDAFCVAVDFSDAALALTEENALRLGVCDRLKTKKLDLISCEPDIPADLFACNPPYIPSRDIEDLSENVKREPRLALDGGEDGLDFYRRIKLFADELKKPFVCETGFDQKKSLTALFGNEALFFKDAGGRDRAFYYVSK